MTGRVIVVGSLNIDLVVNVPRLPAPGETVTGGSFARHDGGKGGNQAVAAARLGVPTLFVGAVGDDAFGAQARQALEAEGIDASELVEVPGEATGVALIVVDGTGENQIAVASGANARMTPDQVAQALGRIGPRPGDVILTGLEVPAAAVREALRIGRSTGATTILNPAPANGLDRSMTGLADVLTPNRSELAALATADAARTGKTAPSDPAAAARSLVERSAEGEGAPAVLVTLGPAGAILVMRGASPAELPAPGVDAVDSVGAGDALNGALAAALAEGRPLEQAATRAVVAASLSTTRAGARGGMPTTDELEAALRASGDRA